MVNWAFEIAGKFAVLRDPSRFGMRHANPERPHDGIRRDDQFGMVEQMLKVLELPFAFIFPRIIGWQFIVDNRQGMPTPISRFIIGKNVCARIVSPIEQHADI